MFPDLGVPVAAEGGSGGPWPNAAGLKNPPFPLFPPPARGGKGGGEGGGVKLGDRGWHKGPPVFIFNFFEPGTGAPEMEDGRGLSGLRLCTRLSREGVQSRSEKRKPAKRNSRCHLGSSSDGECLDIHLHALLMPTIGFPTRIHTWAQTTLGHDMLFCYLSVSSFREPSKLWYSCGFPLKPQQKLSSNIEKTIQAL